MQYENVKLHEVFPALAAQSRFRLIDEKGGCFEPTLTIYCPDHPEMSGKQLARPSVLICPGGSYRMVSSREAEPVALKFVSQGYNAFVLDYTVAPGRYPLALLELSCGMAFIRKYADRLHTARDAIAVAGFSAGGHLAACLGTLWKQPFLTEQTGLTADDFRPNALVLCYPVISSGRFAHEDSFDALLGKGDSGRRESLSLENRVSADTPPAFMWHTVADSAVPVENSMLFASALQKQHVPFELHIYPEGGHGMSLCTVETACGQPSHINPHCSTWFSLCDQWLHLVFSSYF